jgi:hypothetical protein
MAEYELMEDVLVGAFARARVSDFERNNPGSSVYAADNRGVWDVRFTYGNREKGTAYISAPEAVGRLTRIRWPSGDMEKMKIDNTAGFEGFILAALKMEEQEPAP